MPIPRVWREAMRADVDRPEAGGPLREIALKIQPSKDSRSVCAWISLGWAFESSGQEHVERRFANLRRVAGVDRYHAKRGIELCQKLSTGAARKHAPGAGDRDCHKILLARRNGRRSRDSLCADRQSERSILDVYSFENATTQCLERRTDRKFRVGGVRVPLRVERRGNQVISINSGHENGLNIVMEESRGRPTACKL